MPYKKSKLKKGKRRYAMKSLRTGKTYHYKTAAARKKGMKMHHAFAHGFKMTKKRKR
jgi:hypothetical protein